MLTTLLGEALLCCRCAAAESCLRALQEGKTLNLHVVGTASASAFPYKTWKETAMWGEAQNGLGWKRP